MGFLFFGCFYLFGCFLGVFYFLWVLFIWAVMLGGSGNQSGPIYLVRRGLCPLERRRTSTIKDGGMSPKYRQADMICKLPHHL